MSEDEDFEREEQAFRAALRDELAGESFRPLDPAAFGSVSGGSRTPRPWGRVLAAAAAVVVVVTGIGVVLPRLIGTSASSASSATVAGVPEAAGGAAERAEDKASVGTAGSAPVPSPVSYTGASLPDAGNRWESYRDVMVQVPASWGYAFAPASDYCSRENFPSEPYVDLARGGEGINAILCTKPLADDRQAMHLTFSPAGSEAPLALPSTVWRQFTRTVGQAKVTVTATDSQSELANAILDSAEVFPDGLDPNGCPASQPSVPAANLKDLDGSQLTVCLYEAETDRGAFRSSVRLSGSAASHAWKAVLAAPGGGGPDGDASSCGTGQGWPVVLYVGPERVPVAASLAGCTENGVADAAAKGGLRALTRDLCRSLLVDPVRISMGFGPAAARCLG